MTANVKEQARWAQVWNVTTPGHPLYLRSGSHPTRKGMTHADALATMPADFAIATPAGRVWVHWCIGLGAER